MKLMWQQTIKNLAEGELYKFYVVAINNEGKSGRSPILSTVAGTTPGRDANLDHRYAQIKPKITDVEETSISLSWPSPEVNSTGSSPITGYKVYMFPGVALNSVADPDPVKREIQTVKTYIADSTSERRLLEIENAQGHFQIHLTLPDHSSGVGSEKYTSDKVKFAATKDLKATATAEEVKRALERALENANYAGQTVVVTERSYTTSANTAGKAWNVFFDTFDGSIPHVAIMDF
jgi:hypothetical protein